jgi:hypothetical protein
MPGFVPDPVAVSAIKLVGYSAFGWLVQRWGQRRGNPILFGVARVAAGWLVGIAFVAALTTFPLGSGEGWSVALLLFGPRLAMWALLIRLFFRPRGGMPALLLWALAGTLLSTGISAVIEATYKNTPWLRAGLC